MKISSRQRGSQKTPLEELEVRPRPCSRESQRTFLFRHSQADGLFSAWHESGIPKISARKSNRRIAVKIDVFDTLGGHKMPPVQALAFALQLFANAFGFRWQPYCWL